MIRLEKTSAAVFAALLVVVSGSAAAQTPKPRLLVNGKNSVKAYSAQNPCQVGIAEVDIIAEDPSVFAEAQRAIINDVIFTVAFVVGDECASKQVRIRKITFAGYAGGKLYFAAAATPNGGWSRVRTVAIDAASPR